MEHDHSQIYIATTKRGVCYVGSPYESYEEFEAQIQKRFPKSSLVENKQALMTAINQLHEYFAGRRKTFTLPIDVNGTTFQEQVWKALMEIPYGKTSSYSNIAELIDNPFAVRAVGTAVGANPILIIVPCHRVIGKNGALTGYRGGIDFKKNLLQLEIENDKDANGR